MWILNALIIAPVFVGARLCSENRYSDKGCEIGLISQTIIENEPLKIPLESIKVKSEVLGTVVHSAMEFTYINEYNNPIEAIFSFPVGSNTAVYNMTAEVNGDTIIGYVKAREKAKEEYQAAVDQGKSAALLEENENASDILILSVGNIDKFTTATVKIHQVSELSVRKTRKGMVFNYNFPTSLFTRYNPKPKWDEISRNVFYQYQEMSDSEREVLQNKPLFEVESGESEESPDSDLSTSPSSGTLPFIDNLRPFPPGKNEYFMDFELKVYQDELNNDLQLFSVDQDLTATLKKEKYANYGQNVKTDKKNDSPIIASFSFKNSSKVFEKDNDVVITMMPKMSLLQQMSTVSPAPMASAVYNLFEPAETPFSSNVLKSTFILDPDWDKIPQNEIQENVIIADCSGSMYGDRIEDSKEMLKLLVRSLPSKTKFNIIKFGSMYTKLFDGSQEYNSENMNRAIEMLDKMEADCGGTELVPAMKSVLIQEGKRNVFIFTDGAISNTEDAISLATKYKGTNRIFSFGIGSGASTTLVNGLADASDGYASFVAEYDRDDLKEFFTDQSLSEIVVNAIVASSKSFITNLTLCVEYDSIEDSSNNFCDSSQLPKVIVEGVMFSKYTDVLEKPGKILLKYNDDTVILQAGFNNRGLDYGNTAFGDGLSLPLHRLQAKIDLQNMVKQLADGNNWDTEYDKVEKMVVELSTMSNVLSPLTAIVAIGESLEGEGEMESIEIPRYQGENTMYPGNSGMIMGRGRMMGGVQPMMAMAPVPATKGMMMNQPSYYGGTFLSAPASPNYMYYDMAMDESADTSTTQPPTTTQRDPSYYQHIINHQNVNGWFSGDLLDEFLESEELEELRKNCNYKGKKLPPFPVEYFSTCVAVTKLLSSDYDSKFFELRLILNKAVEYLGTRNQQNVSQKERKARIQKSKAIVRKIARVLFPGDKNEIKEIVEKYEDLIA